MPDTITLKPIGHVRGGRDEPIDDDWDSVEAAIQRHAHRRGGESARRARTQCEATAAIRGADTDPTRGICRRMINIATIVATIADPSSVR